MIFRTSRVSRVSHLILFLIPLALTILFALLYFNLVPTGVFQSSQSAESVSGQLELQRSILESKEFDQNTNFSIGKFDSTKPAFGNLSQTQRETYLESLTYYVSRVELGLTGSKNGLAIVISLFIFCLIFGCGFIISLTSKIIIYDDFLELNLLPLSNPQKIYFNQIKELVKDEDFKLFNVLPLAPERYFLVTKNNEGATLYPRQWENFSQLLRLLNEKLGK